MPRDDEEEDGLIPSVLLLLLGDAESVLDPEGRFLPFTVISMDSLN